MRQNSPWRSIQRTRSYPDGGHPHRTGNQDNETAQIMALCGCQALANRDYRNYPVVNNSA